MPERDESLSGDAEEFTMEITDVHSNDVKKIYPHLSEDGSFI